MADIPRNSTYTSGTGSQVPNIKVPSSLVKPKTQIQDFASLAQMQKPKTVSEQLREKGISSMGVPSNTTPLTSGFSEPSLIPLGKQLKTPTYGNQPLTEEYINEQASIIDPSTGKPKPGLTASQTPQGARWVAPNIDTTTFRSSPNIEGQYLVDSSQPGEFVKSGRGLTTEEKKIYLDGRPSFLYQVDHIVPLWADGADTPENYQVLTNPEHAKKTKAQAVAYTLWANNKLTKQQAKLYAVTWKDRDLSDIPDPDQYGTLDVDVAQKIKERWDKQMSEPAPVTWKSFMSSIVPAGKETGAKIDKATEGLPALIQGAIKGLASAGTFGWVKYGPELNNKGGWETTGNVLGSIAGSLIPIEGLARVFGWAGQGVRALSVSKKIKESGVVGKTVAEVATGVTKPKAILFRGSATPAQLATRKLAVDSFVKYTPAVVTYGQAQESFEETAHRGTRFLEDVFYGGVTGFVPPSVKGTMGVAATTFLTSLMTSAYKDSDDPLTDALITAGTMGALHGISAPGIRKQAEINSQKIIEDELPQFAHTFFSSYLDDKVKDIGIMNQSQLNEVRVAFRQKLNEMAFGKANSIDESAASPLHMDLERLNGEIKTGESLLKFMEIRNLPVEQREPAMLNELYSAIMTSRNGGGLRSAPPIAMTITDSLPKEVLDMSTIYSKTPDSGNYVTGFGRLTGLGEQVNPNGEKLSQYGAFLAKGQASRTLIGVKRGDMEAYLRQLTNDPNIKWTDSNPANTIHVFGISWDDKGVRQLHDLGFMPQEKRIEGDKYSFNNQKEIKEGKIEKYPLYMNKDVFGSKMNELGLDYVFLNFDADNSGFRKGKSGDFTKGNKNEPYISITTNEDSWLRSIESNRLFAEQTKGTGQKSIPHMISDINTAFNPKKKIDTVSELVQSVKKPSVELFNEPAAQKLINNDPAGSLTTQTVLNEALEAINQKTPKAFSSKLNKSFGVELNENEANTLFLTRNEMTNKELFSILSEKGSPETQMILTAGVNPFIGSPVFKKWEYGTVFPSLKVAGGLKTEIPATIKPNVKSQAVTKETAQEILPTTEKQQPLADVTVQEPTPITQEQPAFVSKKEVGIPKAPKKKKTLGEKVAENVSKEQKKTKEVSPKKEGVVSPANVESVPVQKTETISDVSFKKVTIPQNKKEFFNTPKERQKFISDIINETVEIGRQGLEETAFTKIGGESGYSDMLRSKIESIRPNIQDNQFAPGGKLTSKEKQFITSEARRTLRSIAENVYGTKISTPNSVEFRTNLKPGDEMYSEVSRLLEAQEAAKMGDKMAIKDLQEELGDDDFKKALKILNPEADVSFVDKKKEGVVKKDFDYLSWNQTKKHAGDEIVKQLVDIPKKLPEGQYMRTFADYVDKAMTKSLGKDWRKNEIVTDVLASLNSKGSNNEFSFFGKLLNSTEGTKTQPIDYLRTLGKGDQSKANEIRIKRGTETLLSADETLNRKSKIDSGRFSDESIGNESRGMLSADEFGRGMSIETVAQRGDTNVPTPSPIDKVLAGLTSAIHDGKVPTAQNALSDASNFIFKFNTAYKEAYNFKNKKGFFVTPQTTSKLSIGEKKPTWVNVPKWEKFTVKEASSIKNEIITDLSKKGIKIGGTGKAGKLVIDAIESQTRIKKVNDEVKTIIKEKILPEYKNLQKLGLVPKSKTFQEMPINEKLQKISEILYAKNMQNKDLKKEEMVFSDDYRKYQNLFQTLEELKQLKDIAKSDYINSPK